MFFTFNKLLKKNGYNTDRAVIMHPEVRLKLKQFDPLPKKYWPKKYKHIIITITVVVVVVIIIIIIKINIIIDT